jgi:5-methyltetrahydropteroyltriglutamate--homocysteine methyltransferase
MPLPTGVYRGDHVGSLLRPTAIKNARQQHANGEITAVQLREIEDKEIADVVTKQLASGLKSITDGEFRRAYFHLDFLQQVGGVEVQGKIQSSNQYKDGWSPPKLVVTGEFLFPLSSSNGLAS